MTRRHSSSGITKNPRPAAAPRDERRTAAPPPPPASPQSGGIRWALAASIIVLIAVALWAALAMKAARQLTPGVPLPSPAVSEEEMLCARFAKLRNAGDPGATALLGRVPAVPEGPVSPEEANRLQADWFLREPIEISRVGPDHARRAGPAARFVFVTKGNVSAPALQERTPTGVVRSQRTMSNPDITVEVRDGKIYGVRPELHVGP
jgi:hypothetical protein